MVRKSEVVAEKDGEHIFLPLGVEGANDCEPYPSRSCNPPQLQPSPRHDNKYTGVSNQVDNVDGVKLNEAGSYDDLMLCI